MATNEEKLINALGLDKLTDEESRYLQRILPKVDIGIPEKGKISIERARELFDKRFPNSKWRMM